MAYRMMGRGHAALALLGGRLRSQLGQGTVEYVALILLVAAVMGAVVAASGNKSAADKIAQAVTGQIKGAIDSVVPSK